MTVPEELSYTSSHEWVSREGARIRLGITKYAQDALGDVVFVELPSVGKELRAGDAVCEVESTKAVSEVFTPVSGKVLEVNEVLNDSPERINEDPYGEGWLCVIEVDETGDDPKMLDAAGYRGLIG